MHTSMSPEQLKQARADLGLSLSQAANQVHITPRSWARYESGDRPIPEGVIHLFCLVNGLEYPLKVS
jgi:transcriptional regulator with XRE-family HTH domain